MRFSFVHTLSLTHTLTRLLQISTASKSMSKSMKYELPGTSIRLLNVQHAARGFEIAGVDLIEINAGSNQIQLAQINR